MPVWRNWQTQRTLKGKKMTIDKNGLHLYECKDRRERAYNPISKKVTSYPRALMEQKLGRPLKENEQVHHIDGNPSNNNIENLAIMMLGEHQRMHNPKHVYTDKEMVCPWCQKTFVWSAKAQKNFHRQRCRKKPRNKNPILKPFCSKHCSGSYSRQEQLKRNFQSKCALNGETSPSDNHVPTTV